jgi:hypothetical protein
MTLTWLRPLRPLEGPLREALPASESELVPEPEFDEEGRRYAFRFPRRQRQPVSIDRERLFEYVATHKLPATSDRVRLRDQRNAANFFEDVRDIQTHAEVQEIAEKPRESAKPLRSVS